MLNRVLFSEITIKKANFDDTIHRNTQPREQEQEQEQEKEKQ
jgi:hypothetical protein